MLGQVSVIKKLLHKFSCRYYTELSSQILDRKLTPKESFLFYLHHFICTFCRRFSRQINIIERGLKRGSVLEDSDVNLSLSAEKKQKIKEKLKHNYH